MNLPVIFFTTFLMKNQLMIRNSSHLSLDWMNSRENMDVSLHLQQIFGTWDKSRKEASADRVDCVTPDPILGTDCLSAQQHRISPGTQQRLIYPANCSPWVSRESGIYTGSGQGDCSPWRTVLIESFPPEHSPHSIYPSRTRSQGTPGAALGHGTVGWRSQTLWSVPGCRTALPNRNLPILVLPSRPGGCFEV